MLCCVLLCGLAFLGPRGVRLLRLFRESGTERWAALPPVEVASSRHLVLSRVGADLS